MGFKAAILRKGWEWLSKPEGTVSCSGDVICLAGGGSWATVSQLAFTEKAPGQTSGNKHCRRPAWGSWFQEPTTRDSWRTRCYQIWDCKQNGPGNLIVQKASKLTRFRTISKTLQAMCWVLLIKWPSNKNLSRVTGKNELGIRSCHHGRDTWTVLARIRIQMATTGAQGELVSTTGHNCGIWGLVSCISNKSSEPAASTGTILWIWPVQAKTQRITHQVT